MVRGYFDTVDREALYLKLYNAGISSRFITTLKNMFSGTMASVWTPLGKTEPFLVASGLRQGCLLSPLLFALYVNDLEDEFEKGMQVGTQLIKVILYADDIVIMAENPVALQKNIFKLEGYCEYRYRSIYIRFQRGGT